MSTYSYKPPVKNTQPSPQQSSSGESKSRIYQIFNSTIKLDELSLPTGETKGGQKIESLVSLQLPLIKINNYIVSNEEIELMVIDTTDFIPTIMLKCTFLQQTFISTELPKDGDIISIAIRNKTDLLKPLRNDYVITGVSSLDNPTNVRGMNTLTFFGMLFLPGMLNTDSNFSFNGTSFDAIKQLAKDNGLGFATNEDQTNDKQIWINGSITAVEFIKDTVNHAWKDEKSFFKAWVDIYYNLNFININKQLLSSEDEVDIGAWINNVDKDVTFGDDTEIDKVIDTPKVLSNYEMFKNTSFYIQSWKPNNRASNITFQVGSKINGNLFEHNKILYDDINSTKNWSIGIEPTYDENKVNSHILLRGRSTQNTDAYDVETPRANYSYPEIYIKKVWMGIQYTVSNSDDDPSQWNGNHHKNYHRAEIQNFLNKKELDKLDLEIKVRGVNLNIIKGDKTPVVLIKTDPIGNAMIDPDKGDSDMLDNFYSGWFYVKGFKLKYSQERIDSVYSNFDQTFILSRREWPTPISVDPMTTENNE